MDANQILILTALQSEANAVFAALKAAGARSAGIQVQIIGIRARRIPAIGWPSSRVLILAGLAGALDPRLRVGDVVVEGVPKGIRLPHASIPGRVVASPDLAATPERKRELREKTGAAAVDMECDIVRRAALEAGSGLVVVRAISDAADHGIDPALLGFVDDTGKVKLGALLKAVMRRPGLIPRMIRLGHHASIASRAMGKAVGELVGELLAATEDVWRAG